MMKEFKHFPKKIKQAIVNIDWKSKKTMALVSGAFVLIAVPIIFALGCQRSSKDFPAEVSPNDVVSVGSVWVESVREKTLTLFDRLSQMDIRPQFVFDEDEYLPKLDRRFGDSAAPSKYVTKEMLIGAWVSVEINSDVRTSFTFNEDNTGSWAFFDGGFLITEYTIIQEEEKTLLTYTKVASEYDYHLNQEPVTTTCELEYISDDEFALIRWDDEHGYETIYKRGTWN